MEHPYQYKIAKRRLQKNKLLNPRAALLWHIATRYCAKHCLKTRY